MEHKTHFNAIISVVIPLFNKESSIIRTIESVLNQGIENIEIVVVNDGSTDNSVSVLGKLEDRRIRLISQNNGGPSKARNTGVLNATGEWVLFLDADDELLPGAFENFTELKCRFKGANCFAYNFYTVRNGESSEFYHTNKIKVYNNPARGWCYRSLFPRTGAAFFKKDILDKYMFREDLRRFEDAEWLFRIMREESFVRSPFCVMKYNKDSAAASVRRKDISEDFMGHLDFKGKSIWEQVALYQLLKDAYLSYPEEATALYMDLGISNTRLLFVTALTCFSTIVIRKTVLLKRI